MHNEVAFVKFVSKVFFILVLFLKKQCVFLWIILLSFGLVP